tara:strand:- start:111 stop:329 length:219 start_codon:yes stop_codon:yes gene_type:complete
MAKDNTNEMQDNATSNLKKYTEEVQKVQERKNQVLQELDALNRTEQRLVGAMAGLQELLGVEDDEKKEKVDA